MLPPPHPLLPGTWLHRQIQAPSGSLHTPRTESAINPWKALLPPKPPLIEQTPHGAADTFIDFILKPHFILHLDPVDCNHRLSALSSWYNRLPLSMNHFLRMIIAAASRTDYKVLSGKLCWLLIGKTSSNTDPSYSVLSPPILSWYFLKYLHWIQSAEWQVVLIADW